MSVSIPQLIEDEQVRQVFLNKKLSNAQKDEKISEIKQSFMVKQTSSFRTIVNCSNSLIGSSTLVMPIYFQQTGVLSAFILAIVIGCVNFTTVRLVLRYHKRSEGDFADIILRILGSRAHKFYVLLIVGLMLVIGIASFLLISNILYATLGEFIQDLPSKDTITFSSFSYQWAGLIVSVLMFTMYNVKRMSMILTISSYGMYCVAFYIVYIIYLGLSALINGNVSFNEAEGGLPLFKLDFSKLTTLMGIFALGYLGHPMVIAIAKYNKNYDKNQRDIGISFAVTGVMYALIGFMGAMAINFRPACKPGTNPASIMECLAGSQGFIRYVTFAAQMALIFQLSSITPVLNFIARELLFKLFYDDPAKIPKSQFVGLNTITIGLQLALQILNTKPSMVISFAGTVCGFVIVYVLPIMIHFKKIKEGGKSSVSQSLMGPGEYLEAVTSPEEKSLIVTGAAVQLQNVESESSEEGKVGVGRWLFYGSLTLYGFAIMSIELYKAFSGHH